MSKKTSKKIEEFMKNYFILIDGRWFKKDAFRYGYRVDCGDADAALNLLKELL